MAARRWERGVSMGGRTTLNECASAAARRAAIRVVMSMMEMVGPVHAASLQRV